MLGLGRHEEMRHRRTFFSRRGSAAGIALVLILFLVVVAVGIWLVQQATHPFGL